jgi:hypothetical protein
VCKARPQAGAIIDALAARPGTQAVLLANLGGLVVGGTPAEAAAPLALVEAAEAELATAALGGAVGFPPARWSRRGHPWARARA